MRRIPFGEILETLEAHYGPQQPCWPTDPYRFIVWWHCGYPASDATCAKGWESLRREIGVDPDQLLAADQANIAQALRSGGMVPELRALRLIEIAQRVQREFGGDLNAALKAMPTTKVRAALKKFSGIADPGADRIILFSGIAPLAAVPSNCPQVLVRIARGRERENYGVNYRHAQEIIEAELPPNVDSRMRAYLLLKQHGQQLCKRTNPKCQICPVREACAYVRR